MIFPSSGVTLGRDDLYLVVSLLCPLLVGMQQTVCGWRTPADFHTQSPARHSIPPQRLPNQAVITIGQSIYFQERAVLNLLLLIPVGFLIVSILIQRVQLCGLRATMLVLTLLRCASLWWLTEKEMDQATLLETFVGDQCGHDFPQQFTVEE